MLFKLLLLEKIYSRGFTVLELFSDYFIAVSTQINQQALNILDHGIRSADIEIPGEIADLLHQVISVDPAIIV